MVEALLEQATWLTPTSLFLLLNLVIATIVFSSSFSHRRTNQPDNNNNHDPTSAAAPPPYNPPQLARAPSLFSRVTSFNLSNYYPHPHHDHQQDRHHQQDRRDTVDTPPSFFSRVASFKFSGRVDGPDPDEGATPEPEAEAEPESKMEVKRAVVRSPSFLSRVASFTVGGRGFMQGEDCEVDAQCNNKGDEGKKVGEKVMKKGKGKKKKTERVETAPFRKNEEEVDAKADDFINRFKQQLKLQRIESLMRYRSA